jgi:hypothetical protein
MEEKIGCERVQWSGTENEMNEVACRTQAAARTQKEGGKSVPNCITQRSTRKAMQLQR